MADEQTTYSDSKEAMDVGDPSSSKPGAKRRASRAGTRSVASLTPDQLARKRANDREAQRSIRQRTKTHIEELEQRIRELSQDQDARDFEQIKRRNTELEEELRQLRELLGRPDSSVASSPELTPLPYETRYGMDIIEDAQPLSYSPSWSTQNIGGPGSPYSPFPTSRAGDLLSSFAPDHSGLASGFSDPGSARSDVFNDAEINFKDLSSSPTAPIPVVRRGGPNSRPQFGRSRSYPHGRFGIPSSHPPLGMNGNMNGNMPSPLAGQPNSPVNRSLIMNVNGLRHPPPPTSHPLTLNQSKPRTDSTASPQQNGITYEVPGPLGSVPARAAWELSLQFLPPVGPVDSIFMGLLQRQRSIATEDIRLLIGPYHPDLRALMNPEMSNNIHPVSSIISNLLSRMDYPGFADKAAALFLVYHFFQWQILPSMETYQNIPDWFHPRQSEIVTAHPIWTSLLIWGPLRDVVIGHQQKYATEEFMGLYQSCVTVNWPFRDEDILVLVGDEVRVTDAFVRHIEIQENWSLNEPFQRRYPELRDVCRFSEATAP